MLLFFFDTSFSQNYWGVFCTLRKTTQGKQSPKGENSPGENSPNLVTLQISKLSSSQLRNQSRKFLHVQPRVTR
jgi:hypothetical protein